MLAWGGGGLMQTGRCILAACAVAASSAAWAARVPAPTENDARQAIAIETVATGKAALAGVKDIRCRTRRLSGRISMSGNAIANAKCNFRHMIKDENGLDSWRKSSVTLEYSGTGCGDEGQEADLVCYSWGLKI
jgi:hypothetical protein